MKIVNPRENSVKTQFFAISKAFNHQKLFQEIEPYFRIKKIPRKKQYHQYFDTFDWRLHNNGMFLFREKNTYHLNSYQNYQNFDSITVKPESHPKFWWDFPDGPTQQKLSSLLDIRALILLAKTYLEISPYQILNEDEKNILTFFFIKMYLYQKNKNTLLNEFIEIQSIRGYRKEYQTILQIIKNKTKLAQAPPVLDLIFEKSGLIPGGYSSKINVDLTADMPTRIAIRKILERLLDIMRKNQAGVKKDIDSEFLHDFRVAIRRTHSALSLIKEVFPAKDISYFKSVFKKLQKLSNRSRDLDVYLLKEKTYRETLPGELEKGLDSFFTDLRTEKRLEHQKMMQIFNQKDYKNCLNQWEKFLKRDTLPHTRNSTKPVKEIASIIIFKRFQKILQIGKRIKDKTPPGLLHRLRIECKKLRYLLEFFQSLYPKRSMSYLINHLKSLQDNLGTFNDLSIQQEELKKYISKYAQNNQNSILVFASLGGLISNFYQQQLAVRGSFQDVFNKFKAQKNIHLYQQLFNSVHQSREKS
jgi:CHAD domain-containing protein